MNSAGRVTKRRRVASSAILRGAFYFFLTAGLLALIYVGYVIAQAHAYQAIQESRFEKISRTEGPRPLMEGGVMGEIQVPRLGMKAIVVEGDSPEILQRAVGHIASTAVPGEDGNVALAGHRDTFFRPLRQIHLGDTITLKTRDGDFQYEVESTAVVSPSYVEVLKASGGRTLTLITCFPFNYLGSAPNRFVVRAHEVRSLPQLTGH